MHVRTLAAILVWFVVALLLINRLLRSEWILPISIVLTVVAVLIYFSPRLRKKQPAEHTDTKVTPKEPSQLRRVAATFFRLRRVYLCFRHMQSR
jgi:hypothetical protein